MDRRSFLAMLGLAPAAAAIQTVTPSSAEKPLEFSAGAARLNLANIGTITRGRIVYPSGAVIDFDAGTITFG